MDLNLDEIRERYIDLEYHRQEEERESKRHRTLQESQNIVSKWIDSNKRKKKVRVRVTIVRDYVMKLDLWTYLLRLHINGELIEKYNVEIDAGRFLCENKDYETLSELDFFTLFDNYDSK